MPPPSTTTSTNDAPTIAMARLGVITGENGEVADSDWLEVHFNPSSLQLQVSNELKDTDNNERKQYIAKANAKLTLELQFDTTLTGDDVTQKTQVIQSYIAPPADQQGRDSVPPPVV